MSEERDRRPWTEKYASLKGFVLSKGRLPYASAPDEPEKTLGQWRNAQKQYYAEPALQHYLTPERVKLLEEIPGWQWGEAYRPWEEIYAEFRSFVEAHGQIPNTTSSSLQETTLAHWAARQQQKNKGVKGERGLSEERRALLSAIPGWTWTYSNATKWEIRYEKVLTIVEANPTVTIHALKTETWEWLKEQAQKWELLSSDQRKKLEALPLWPLERKLQARWLAHYRLLLVSCQNASQGGSIAVPYETLVWLLRQEKRFSELSNLQQELLEILERVIDDKVSKYDAALTLDDDTALDLKYLRSLA